MEIFTDDTEFTDIRMARKVVDMFGRHPRIQRIVQFGLLGIPYEDDVDVTDDDDYYEIIDWDHAHKHGWVPEEHARVLGVNHTRSSNSFYQLPRINFSPAREGHSSPAGKIQSKETDTESRARLLQETKKSKEKKRLKKRKQKERKRREKLGKEKQNPVKNVEGEDDPQESNVDENKPVNAKSKNDTNTSVAKELASAKDSDRSDSSEDNSSEEDDNKNDSSDSEELDLTSTFVSKAARKLDQKPRPERKEKKKIPVKEEATTVPEKTEVQKVDKQEPTMHCGPTFEDNIKISTDLATVGNRFASAGEFNMAVKYFTDAIKYNPTEYKLFGNRSFCFEKMQEYEKALTDAELCLSMFPGWVKGLFRKGRALAGLKRYEEACQAFREVLKMDSSCTEVAQELMRVQITQLMECGFTREQSSNALIIHGTVNKALEVLSKLNKRPGAIQNATFPPVQVANITGTSPVLSANTNPAAPQSQEPPKTPLIPVQNMSNFPPKHVPNQTMKINGQPPLELFPVWVGNLIHPVPESAITDLFNKVGVVHSVKLLTQRRCAFINFTKRESCNEAIQRFHGSQIMGNKIAVRYPDRIPHGLGISNSALKADENWRRRGPSSSHHIQPQRPLQILEEDQQSLKHV